MDNQLNIFIRNLYTFVIVVQSLSLVQLFALLNNIKISVSEMKKMDNCSQYISYSNKKF